MVEGASLENWNTGNRIGGSNPSLSAMHLPKYPVFCGLPMLSICWENGNFGFSRLICSRFSVLASRLDTIVSTSHILPYLAAPRLFCPTRQVTDPIGGFERCGDIS